MEGDVGNITVLPTRSDDSGNLINPLEIPVNVASVAGLATMYLLAYRGYVEGLNLFEINRVAGIVWIRQILLMRSLSAIGMLSTEVLTLDGGSGLWGFRRQTHMAVSGQAICMFKTFLAAGEVSWLGFVLNDFLMVVTQQSGECVIEESPEMRRRKEADGALHLLSVIPLQALDARH
ncbi:hypothetical protein H257_06907 [Aphanomyces astaci]|uniref:Uncharacterized protein n=1 Tax=Aphanomyces astaci TaxID=112090 RepID=W4GKV0_APHAT|nr:hypothetical protein H257_06907 [Aphanomyces astaci]ETV79654.1 hypothetical protein H257_06907 [Aphanomyces astaci]|eukprot:XP_009830590.1 hypothetical protein H257_06907 [Aphanomyces astaci]